jgi:hypothetical protein
MCDAEDGALVSELMVSLWLWYGLQECDPCYGSNAYNNNDAPPCR